MSSKQSVVVSLLVLYQCARTVRAAWDVSCGSSASIPDREL